MSIIIVNIRNPAPKFKFCSVFSAKNPTVNDASGVTMLFAEVGMICGNPAIDGNPSHRRRTLVCERRGSLCSGRWIFVAVDVDIVDDFFSLITFY